MHVYDTRPCPTIVGQIIVDDHGRLHAFARKGLDGEWARLTKPDDLTAAARTVNAKLQSWGYDCDDTEPG